MKTVFVKYHEYVNGGHSLLDGEWFEKGEVIEIENLLDLNSKYKHLIDVRVLDNGDSNIHIEKGPFAD